MSGRISSYAKDRYGSAFLITVNFDLGACEYFPDLGKYVDGGYYQNTFFSWDGSAVVDGRGLSTSKREFRNPALDFARAQGLSMLDMDHLGTGPVSSGLDFKNYDDRITEENLCAIDASGWVEDIWHQALSFSAMGVVSLYATLYTMRFCAQ